MVQYIVTLHLLIEDKIQTKGRLICLNFLETLDVKNANFFGPSDVKKAICLDVAGPSSSPWSSSAWSSSCDWKAIKFTRLSGGGFSARIDHSRVITTRYTLDSAPWHIADPAQGNDNDGLHGWRLRWCQYLFRFNWFIHSCGSRGVQNPKVIKWQRHLRFAKV